MFKELADGILSETALRDKGAGESWQLFEDIFIRAQTLLIPVCKKPGKQRRRPALLSKDFLVKLKHKREEHRQWKQHIHPEQNIGILLRTVGMGSGRLRHT